MVIVIYYSSRPLLLWTNDIILTLEKCAWPHSDSLCFILSLLLSIENLWNFKSEFCIQVECFPYKSINYSTQGLNNQSPIWMIADSKIPEMPLKCIAEVFFPCPAHLSEVILSWTCSHAPPTLQKLYCHGLLPMSRPPFCCFQKYIVMDPTQLLLLLWTHFLLVWNARKNWCAISWAFAVLNNWSFSQKGNTCWR